MKSQMRTLPAMSPEAMSTPRRENASRVMAAGCAAGNWPSELLRGQVPNLDLGLVGRGRIDRIAVAGDQVTAVGRERDRGQAGQLAGCSICAASCAGLRVPDADFRRPLFAAVDSYQVAAVGREHGLDLAGQVGQLLPQGAGGRLDDQRRAGHALVHVARADGQRAAVVGIGDRVDRADELRHRGQHPRRIEAPNAHTRLHGRLRRRAFAHRHLPAVGREGQRHAADRDEVCSGSGRLPSSRFQSVRNAS